MTITPTQQAIYNMLTENTEVDYGALDNSVWQRNSEHPIDDFVNGPKAYVKNGNVAASLFHHLDDIFVYEERGTTLLHEFASSPENEHGPWSIVIADWIESLGGSIDESFCTYNSETAFDQEFIGTIVTVNIPRVNQEYVTFEEGYVIIQTRNGAEARSGFSSPRVFRFDNEFETWEFVSRDLEVCCNNADCLAMFRHNGASWLPIGDKNEKLFSAAEELENRIEESPLSETPVEVACPVCESPLRFNLIDVY